METAHINHSGIIKDIDSQNIYVMILSQSACSTCHSKSACHISEMKEKIIQVPLTKENYHLGEKVNVVMKESLGHMAVLLSYVIPIILFIGGLILALNLSGNELIAGVTALIILTAYFFILYAFRSKLKKKFNFSVQKFSDYSGEENISSE